MRDRLALAFRASFALVTIALPLLLATSCARPAACQRNSDCDRAYCFEGECRRDCIDAERDCPAGWVCNVNAQCVPLDQVPPGKADAGAGEDAGGTGGFGGVGGADGGDDVDADIDAGDEDVWVEDGGDDPEFDGGGGSGGVTGDGGSGGRGGRDGGDDLDGGDDDAGNDDAGGGFDGGDEPDGGTVAPTLGLLDLCTSDEECEGDFLCRPMWVGGPRRCTKSCTNNAQCMTGTRCETVGGERICVQSDIGKACNSHSDCHGSCLASRYCTSQCTSGADCPNGYGCTWLGGTKMCVKVAVFCGDPPHQCPGATSACDAGMLVSGCTIPCSSDSDCPQRAAGLPPWKCNQNDFYCDRPGDVVGPQPGGERAQYLCARVDNQLQFVNACSDGLHMDFANWTVPSTPSGACPPNETIPGVSGDSCVDSCRYQGGCPFGFSCVAATKLNANTWRSGLCIPFGGGEVGDHCTRNIDCAFGLCNTTTNKCTRDCSADGICPRGTTCVATGDFVEGIPYKICQ